MKIIAMLIPFLLGPALAGAVNFAKALEEHLSWLQEIPEVAWVDFERNEVTIGWKRLSPEFVAINKKAALTGNRKIRFPVHVWSVKAEQVKWRPGTGPYYCETTAKRGAVTHTSCGRWEKPEGESKIDGKK